MNQGKRYIRNTVIGVYGAVFLFVGANRLYGSVVDTSTSPLLSTALSLGLRIDSDTDPGQDVQLDLASLRDFNQVSVVGDFTVEIVGAPQYKVTFTPTADRATKVTASQSNGKLRLEGRGNSGAKGTAVLRIETPTLTRLYAEGATQLTVNGLRAQELSVRLKGVSVARLQGNQVALWKLYSQQALAVQVDRATLAAGGLRTGGELEIRLAE